MRDCKLLILNGEMSEWSIEHAWKTILATLTEPYRNTSQRSRCNDLSARNLARCDSVNLGISHRFRTHLTQFLHSSQLHLPLYVVVFVGTRRFLRKRSDSVPVIRLLDRSQTRTDEYATLRLFPYAG